VTAGLTREQLRIRAEFVMEAAQELQAQIEDLDRRESRLPPAGRKRKHLRVIDGDQS
jgi:hypothetical protein